jgi:dienelactone hydrolase
MTRTFLALAMAALPSIAPAAAEEVAFPPAGAALTTDAVLPATIPATLTLPGRGAAPFAAVVIVHGSGGLLPQGPEPDYAAALAGAGIAALVIDMWKARGMPSGPAAFGGAGGVDRRPRVPEDTVPDAFGALAFIAARPEIDRSRVGIVGFSWGAAVSLLASSETAAARALPGGLRFAAHAGQYLVCWPFLPDAPAGRAVQAPATGAPVQLHVAGRDDYDDADGGAGCRAMLAAMPEPRRATTELIVHPEATHMWDFKITVPITIADRHSHKGRGGTVHVVTDTALAARTRAMTVAFFQKAFGM